MKYIFINFVPIKIHFLHIQIIFYIPDLKEFMHQKTTQNICSFWKYSTP